MFGKIQVIIPNIHKKITLDESEQVKRWLPHILMQTDMPAGEDFNNKLYSTSLKSLYWQRKVKPKKEAVQLS